MPEDVPHGVAVGIFFDIIPVSGQQGLIYIPQSNDIFVSGIIADNFRHSSDQGICIEKADYFLMQRFRYSDLIVRLFQFGFSDCAQELAE